ncbi:MAG: hypothetical protein KME64_14895 [Scytonematopsis contorta HA4267-MV1]|jgi:hypothetical protein|nr:hypothetical protein [Scytonematopsis contorta HA4267-MV1]
MTLEEEKLAQLWLDEVSIQCPEQSYTNIKTIVLWLLGSKFQQQDIPTTKVKYRWNILHQRYLGVSPEKAYNNLITRLGSAVIRLNKNKHRVGLNHELQRTLLDILQEVLEELLRTDSYIQRQMAEIAMLTNDRELQNTLLLATVEEYCLRPVYNQPLLAYAFVEALECRLEAA